MILSRYVPDQVDAQLEIPSVTKEHAKATTGAAGLGDASTAISACEGVVDALVSVVPLDRAGLGQEDLEIAFGSFRDRMEPRGRVQLADAGKEADMSSLSVLA